MITTQPDPIQPLRFAIKWEMEAPGWMKENPEMIPIQAIGTGPYKFQEWVKGQFVKITADEAYWGTPKPTIKDVVLVSRAEAATRAAGVKTTEFDIGSALTPELCKGIKCIPITPSDTVFVRPNTDHPVLKDKRIRQAMSYAVDRKSIVENLNSGFGLPAAQSVASFIVGYNPNLKPDPFDAEKAKSLVAAAKAGGIPVDRELQMTWLTGRFPRVSEFVEYVTDAWKKVGLNVKPISRDMQGWRDAMNTKEPADKRADLWLNNHGNETGDSGTSLMQYFTCKETRSFYCNEKADKLYKDSTTASFDDRAKMLQEMWAVVTEDVAVVNMFHQQVLWGVTPRIKWEPRPDLLVKFKDITLTQ